MDKQLGVRRTFWGRPDVYKAVSIATTDLAKGRLPWISFKLPHSWADDGRTARATPGRVTSPPS